MDGKRLTGSYYTANTIARYMSDWVIQSPNDILLEPSFGDGVFIDAALSRYSELGKKIPEIIGVELQDIVYRQYMRNAPMGVKGICCDFLSVHLKNKVTSIVGNPPYVSLRNLSNNEKLSALKCAEKNNVRMQTSGSLWMPFVIHSTSMLMDDGRLAFVLPFEFTYVKYAYPLWAFLKDNFGVLKVVRVHEDFFPDVDVETVILFAADKGRKTDHVQYQIYNSTIDLLNNRGCSYSTIEIDSILKGEKPFVYYLLDNEQKNVLIEMRNKNYIVPTITECKFNIGYVCADKEYFHPSPEIQSQFNISEENLASCISNSKDINEKRGIGAVVEGGQCDSKLYLPKNIKMTDEKYIDYGIGKGVNLRYKCKQRNPWYITPSVEVPELILTVFGDAPKLVVNKGKYVVSNSLLGGHLIAEASAKEFVCRWYNSLTLLSVELNVHSLGGGVLVFIPGEADRLEIVSRIPEERVESVFREIDLCIKNNGIQAAYELGDRLVLSEIMGLSDNEIHCIRSAVKLLRDWRKPDLRRGKASA